MSSTCPNCSTPILEDFGLTVCSNCGASVFVEMDGSVRVNDEPAPPVEEHQQAAEEVGGVFVDSNDNEQVESFEPIIAEPEEVFVQEVAPAKSLLSEIADYGNQDLESSKSGIYQYTVVLGGIDTKELREAVKEALTDHRFNWDTEKVLGQVEKGSLKLTQLNPVKASVLINRLKHLELDITWEQNDITL